MKPTLVLDQHFRQIEELFDPASYEKLSQLCHIIGGQNWSLKREVIEDHLQDMAFYVAAHPVINEKELMQATGLKAIVEVAGTFREGIDYDTCFKRNIEVLSCSPGFKYSVAEMAVGMMIAGGRGLVHEHEKFRTGYENWLDDNIGRDFSLYEQKIGFIGYGAIAQECSRLLKPFNPKTLAFDPWLQQSGAQFDNVDFVNLEEVVSRSRCLVVAAQPTDENWKLLSRELIEKMQPGSLVVVISRSHLVDLDALMDAAEQQKITVAIDVFPFEPVLPKDKIRNLPNVILSPHRAAAVEGGRHLIGRMLVHDIEAILQNRTERMLLPANPDTITKILGATNFK